MELNMELGGEGENILLEKVYENFVKLSKLDYSTAYEITSKLINLGFVWEIDNILYPGIPSLFDYIEDKKLK